MTHWHEEKTVNIVEDMETLLIFVMSRLTEFIIKMQKHLVATITLTKSFTFEHTKQVDSRAYYALVKLTFEKIILYFVLHDQNYSIVTLKMYQNKI